MATTTTITTQAMGFDDPSFAVDKMGEDCAPLQFLRELTENSIQAIERTRSGRGEVVWTRCEYLHERDGVSKLACIDNGVGMSGTEIELLINQLFSSSHKQSSRGNFGVGAKIAAATVNPAGLIFHSWKGGEGVMAHLWKDPQSSVWGLKALGEQDGQPVYVLPIGDEYKPKQIKRHGTMVVLCGRHSRENTLKTPAGAAGGLRWIANYLNQRYLELPKGIKLRAWEKAKQGDIQLREITGQRKFLGANSQSKGVVELEGARVHWWVMPPHVKLRGQASLYAVGGHIAAVYGSELYEMRRGAEARQMLQSFGSLLGHSRLALYVEPTDLEGLAPDTARSQLKCDGEPLPYAEWAKQFEEKQPRPIHKLESDLSELAMSSEDETGLYEKLHKSLMRYPITAYRITRRGTVQSGGSGAVEIAGLIAPQDGPEPANGFGTANSCGGGGGPSNGTGAGDKGSGDKRPSGQSKVYDRATNGSSPAASVEELRQIAPKVQWITVKDGTREPGDLEDRAARYLPERHELHINADYRTFQDMLSVWTKNQPMQARATATAQVKLRYKQGLIEKVIRIRAMFNEQWTSEEREKALSPEAFSMAVQDPSLVDQKIGIAVGNALGKRGA